MKADLFSPDVRQFLQLLAAHQVRYVLVGGTAVIYHGHARMTGDVDFFYDRSPENVRRLWAALLEFWSGSVPVLGHPDELLQPTLIVQFGRPPNRIDLIAGLGALSFEAAWSNRIHESIECGGNVVPVWIIGLADLRQSKLQAGRLKDLDDLQHLPPPPAR